MRFERESAASKVSVTPIFVVWCRIQFPRDTFWSNCWYTSFMNKLICKNMVTWWLLSISFIEFHANERHQVQWMPFCRNSSIWLFSIDFYWQQNSAQKYSMTMQRSTTDAYIKMQMKNHHFLCNSMSRHKQAILIRIPLTWKCASEKKSISKLRVPLLGVVNIHHCVHWISVQFTLSLSAFIRRILKSASTPLE